MNISSLIINFERQEKECQHKLVLTKRNVGGYKIRKSCKNCGKLLDWKLKGEK